MEVGTPAIGERAGGGGARGAATNLRLGHADVSLAEQELTVQVGDVDGVEIDHLDVLEAAQREGLEQLAPDAAGANHEDCRSDEGGAGRVSVAGSGSDASKIRETRTFRILGELEIAHGRRHRGRQARPSRARRVLDEIQNLPGPNCRTRVEIDITFRGMKTDTVGLQKGTSPRVPPSRRGYSHLSPSPRLSSRPPEPPRVLASLPVNAFTSASPASALWRSCRT